MKRTPDQNGKYGLTFEEYTSIRNLFGALGVVSHCMDEVKERSELVSNCRENLEETVKHLQDALRGLCSTIPAQKMRSLRYELEHMHIEVKTTKPKRGENFHGITYVDQIAVERLIDRAMLMDCWCCEKCGADVGRCVLRQDIQNLYHYDLPKDWSKGCPLAGKIE